VQSGRSGEHKRNPFESGQDRQVEILNSGWSWFTLKDVEGSV